MKKPRLNRNSRYINGQIPANKLKKFVQTETSDSFIYRSSYEFLFMKWCENNDAVVAWSSEPYSITYFDISSSRNREYFIDFSFVDTSKRVFIVEVKDSKDVKKVHVFRKHLSTIEDSLKRKSFAKANSTEAKNLSKWVAAKEYAKKHGYHFVIADEVFLRKKVA